MVFQAKQAVVPPNAKVIHCSSMHKVRRTKVRHHRTHELDLMGQARLLLVQFTFILCWVLATKSWFLENFHHLSGVNFQALRSFCACSSFSFSESKSVFIRWNNKFTAGSSNVERSCIEDGFCACFKSWIWVCGRQRTNNCLPVHHRCSGLQTTYTAIHWPTSDFSLLY